MRKYRLLKDTPTIKAGTIFQRVTSKYNEPCELMCAMLTNSDTPLPWRVDDIINFDEWFEEVKEFKEWKPKEGEGYKCLDALGEVDIDDLVGCGSFDKFRLSTGNCYPLDTPDEVIIKEQKLIPQAMHRLKVAAKKAWLEFNGSEGPDWSDKNQEKYFIEFSHKSDGFYFYLNGSCQSLGQIYFPTEGSAEYVIDNMQDDLELLFGIE